MNLEPMNLEKRLQHAARDLREVPVAVPPLGHLARRRPRAHAMATPMLVPLLFVAGALFAIGVASPDVDRSIQSDLPAVSGSGSVDPSTTATPVEARDDPEMRSTHAPSALVELQLIEEFVSSARSAKPPAAPAVAAVPATEPTSPADVIGAI